MPLQICILFTLDSQYSVIHNNDSGYPAFLDSLYIYIYINMAVVIHKALKQFVSLCMPTVFVYSDNKSYGSELLFLLS